MSKFNTNQVAQNVTVNLAGGDAYTMTPELELASIALTSFLNEKFYESTNDTISRIQTLIPKCDPVFVAQLTIYARKEFGMRSVSHVLAAELAKTLSGNPLGKKFYNSVVHRPDDMTEILSYYKKNNKSIPASMKKGFSLALNRFNAYSLAKYRAANKDIKMVDLLNLFHPKAVSEEQNIIFKSLVEDTLRSEDTWEAELSEAGQQEDKSTAKKEAWINLIKERKIGYFALLRNLRNIKEQAPEVLDEALQMLVDENLIKKSLVLPFRFDTAYQLFSSGSSEDRKIIVALNKATDIAMNNVPELPGRTLVVVDSSGSMLGKPAQIASLFAAIIVKKNPTADIIRFSDNAEYISFNPMDSVLTIKNGFNFRNGGTNFHAIFETANKPYDRVIILSDMQGWMVSEKDFGYSVASSPKKSFNTYKKNYGVNPVVYSFDLNGYGTLQFPENNVYALAGFSDKIFDVMSLLETDKKALINKIKETKI